MAGTSITPFDSLKAAPERLNPATEMRRTMASAGPLDPKKLLLMTGDIENAIKSGTEEIRRVSSALNVLKESDPTPSTGVPTGF